MRVPRALAIERGGRGLVRARLRSGLGLGLRLRFGFGISGEGEGGGEGLCARLELASLRLRLGARLVCPRFGGSASACSRCWG